LPLPSPAPDSGAVPVTVQTVTGPMSIDELGVTLTHEHVIGDFSTWWDPSTPADLAARPVAVDMLAHLRHAPFSVKDNTRLTDERVAAHELRLYAGSGGRTIMDPTCLGIGRDVAAQRRVSAASGVRIIAGSGHYIRPARSTRVDAMSAQEIADGIVADVLEGVDGTGIRSGFIGEIGITDGSAALTAADERILRGAARAQVRTAVPLMIHLIDPLGDRVLDVVEEEGVDLSATVLCHMTHTQHDLAYQRRLAGRGVSLGYDSFGIEWYFPGSDHQCRPDHEQAAAVIALIEGGLADRLLLSSDIFLKMQLRSFGGGGYGHVLDHVLPRLRRAGIGEDVVQKLMVDNPRALFAHAAAGARYSKPIG